MKSCFKASIGLRWCDMRQIQLGGLEGIIVVDKSRRAVLERRCCQVLSLPSNRSA